MSVLAPDGFRGAVAMSVLCPWAVFVMRRRSQRLAKSAKASDSRKRSAQSELKFYEALSVVALVWLAYELLGLIK